jgi:uncharacterized protein (TIGR02217 family)
MSNAVFPTVSGITWDVTKTPEFSTGVQRSVNMSELRASFASSPVYHFTLHYDILRDDAAHTDFKTLAGFFMARYGNWDSFLFADPDDGVVTAGQFGIGDGATANFPLTRSFGSFNEPVKNLVAAPAIYSNGVLQSSGYSVSGTGVVTFSSPPAVNANLSWSGSYYFRCRFLESAQEFNQFMSKLWEAKQVQLIGSLGTKI